MRKLGLSPFRRRDSVATNKIHHIAQNCPGRRSGGGACGHHTTCWSVSSRRRRHPSCSPH